MRKHFLAVICGLTLGFVLGRDHGIKICSEIFTKGKKSHCVMNYHPTNKEGAETK